MDVNDPNRRWDIPVDWEKLLPLNKDWWDHKEIMTPRGRMITITKARPFKQHAAYQFATSMTFHGTLDFEASSRPLTADDVEPWPISKDQFSEDEITSAMEFIQTG